ncbi:alpha/beta fold hydrolase [Streptomyces auratus]|uniref:Hydrolase n=1 Tax=Streptomyces auratus AGR0001 TaxID=1160718 RepID=J2JTY4_9ACTN|nr:alpha/beta hydrolase [Streptomyces auratus]QTZ90249.1 alpha/beta hydrolase [Streptomyces auratus AGR0001]
MPAFSALDGTELAFHVMGEGEPLLCLPGGPMRASAYLGDLGGLSAHRQLVLLDLRGTGDSGVPADPAGYRCDRQVADVEALRRHLGRDRIDVLAHSAAGDLALLYAARHPEHTRTLTLVTCRARALGLDYTHEHRMEAAALRAAEPWFDSAHQAYQAIWAGTATDAEWDAGAPFFYGRWDAAAQAHAASEVEQTNEEAAEIYAASGAFDPAATRSALASLSAPVLVLAGELDGGPRPHVAAATAQLLPGAELCVQAGGGHYPWLDDPVQFARTVGSFLDRSVPPAHRVSSSSCRQVRSPGSAQSADSC